MAFTCRLPDELEAELELHCEACGAAKSKVIVIALERYLAAHEGPPPVPIPLRSEQLAHGPACACGCTKTVRAGYLCPFCSHEHAPAA